MKLKMFSVYDNVAQAFLPPFFLPNDSMAVRAVADCANDQSHAFGRNPSDYCLYRLGEFEDSLGSFFIEPTLVNLGMASAFVRVDNLGE